MPPTQSNADFDQTGKAQLLKIKIKKLFASYIRSAFVAVLSHETQAATRGAGFPRSVKEETNGRLRSGS